MSWIYQDFYSVFLWSQIKRNENPFETRARRDPEKLSSRIRRSFADATRTDDTKGRGLNAWMISFFFQSRVSDNSLFFSSRTPSISLAPRYFKHRRSSRISAMRYERRGYCFLDIARCVILAGWLRDGINCLRADVRLLSAACSASRFRGFRATSFLKIHASFRVFARMNY